MWEHNFRTEKTKDLGHTLASSVSLLLQSLKRYVCLSLKPKKNLTFVLISGVTLTFVTGKAPKYFMK